MEGKRGTRLTQAIITDSFSCVDKRSCLFIVSQCYQSRTEVNG